MLTWISFTILTTFLWALNNVLDEISINKYVTNEYRYTYWYYLARVPMAIVLFLIFGVAIPSPEIVGVTILSGFINGLPYVFYYKALQYCESYSVALVYVALHPLFTYIVSRVFFHDVLLMNEIVGFLVLLLAGVLSVLRFDKGITVKKELLWILPAAIIWSVGDVLFDYVVSFYKNPVDALSWISVGGALVLFVCWSVPFLRRRCLDSSQPVPRIGYAIFALTLVLIFVSYFAFLSALKYGNVALTSALTASQPLMAFVIALALARFLKKRDAHSYSWHSLFPKFLALCCAVLGVYLISL